MLLGMKVRAPYVETTYQRGVKSLLPLVDTGIVLDTHHLSFCPFYGLSLIMSTIHGTLYLMFSCTLVAIKSTH